MANFPQALGQPRCALRLLRVVGVDPQVASHERFPAAQPALLHIDNVLVCQNVVLGTLDNAPDRELGPPGVLELFRGDVLAL